nr:hypothetical protein [uncultured Undibacterium sp.]
MKNILNIWMQPLHARMNVDSKRTLLIALLFVPAVAEIIAAILYFFRPDKVSSNIFLDALLYGVAANLGISCLIWFVSLIQSVSLQFSPANAGLVPKHRMHIELALIFPVLLFATITLIASWTVQKYFSMWPAFFTVSFLMFMVLLIRSPWTVIPMIVFFQMPTWLKRNGYSDLEDFISKHTELPVSLVLILVALVFVFGGIHWTFSMKSDVLFSRHKKALAYRASLLGQGMVENRITLSFSAICLAWMSYRVKSVSGRLHENSTMLLGFLFGPKLHWTTICFQMFSMAAGGVLAVSLLEFFSARTSKDFAMGFGIGFVGMMILFIPLFFCFMLFYSLYQTRGEQVLLSLAPGTGNAARRDQSLLGYLLRQFVIMYGLSVLAALLILRFADISETKQSALILLVTCLFPLILNLGAPISRMKNANDHPLLRNLLLCVAVFVVGIVLVLIVNVALIWIYTPIVLFSTGYFLWKKTRRNLQTSVFPVGRAV